MYDTLSAFSMILGFDAGTVIEQEFTIGFLCLLPLVYTGLRSPSVANFLAGSGSNWTLQKKYTSSARHFRNLGLLQKFRYRTCFPTRSIQPARNSFFTLISFRTHEFVGTLNPTQVLLQLGFLHGHPRIFSSDSTELSTFHRRTFLLFISLTAWLLFLFFLDFRASELHEPESVCFYALPPMETSKASGSRQSTETLQGELVPVRIRQQG